MTFLEKMHHWYVIQLENMKMSKYSKQLKDSVYVTLKDERIDYVPGELETAIIDTLVPDKKMWRRHWNSPNFSPAHGISDAVELLDVAYPGAEWNLRSKENGTIYECWIKDETYSVFCHTAARALVLAMWNAHNFEHMDEKKALD